MGGVVSAACFGNVLHVICTGGMGSSIDSIISNVGGGKSQEDTEASPHKRELKCDTNISPRRLMSHLLYQMVHYHTNLRGGHSIQMIIKSNQATT